MKTTKALIVLFAIGILMASTGCKKDSDRKF